MTGGGDGVTDKEPGKCEETVWHGCYDRQWRGMIVPEAYSHPARFSRNLIERIFAYGLERGWWKVGDTVADPFAGVGCGGIAATYARLRWVGVEIEERFIELANANFDYHRERWAAPAFVSPTIVHGDSRRFSEVLGAAAGIVTSPPYADSESTRAGGARTAHPDGRSRRIEGVHGYGEETPGQIGNLPPGDLQGIVTSPPYAEGIGHRMKDGGPESEKHPGRVAMQKRYTDSMASEGNIADLPTGKPVDGIVTSPPYEDTPISPQGADGDSQSWNRAYREFRKSGDHKSFQREMRKKCEQAGYGMTEGQVGQDSGETYWQAMEIVYHQCWRVLRPGGMICVVVKDYVKKKARVPLCDQTLALLERVGFEPVVRIRAMLVKEEVEATLFGEVRTRKERKSFFRRLAEKHGAPRIDWEEVLVMRR